MIAQFVVPGLGVVCMWNCTFVDAPKTQEEIPVWDSSFKNISPEISYTLQRISA